MKKILLLIPVLAFMFAGCDGKSASNLIDAVDTDSVDPSDSTDSVPDQTDSDSTDANSGENPAEPTDTIPEDPADSDLLTPDEDQSEPADADTVVVSDEDQPEPADADTVVVPDEDQSEPTDEDTVVVPDEDQSEPADADTVVVPDEDLPETPDDPVDVFNPGPYEVKTTDIDSGTDGAPREFRIYEPTGAEGLVPVIHFLHGFQLKYEYYDDFLTHLASHGFIVVSSQSNHGLLGIGGDSSTEEATKVVALIDWLKQNIQSKVSVTADIENFGVAGHSRGGKVSNRVLNSNPAIAKSFFGVDPVDSAAGTDYQSLNDPVQFKGKSMFLGTEKGPTGIAACAPSGDNSVKFYASYPSPSHHIIAAGVGHNDMLDTNECGLTCSVCASGSNDAAKQFISYTGGLMTAFFNSTLKGMSEYETLLNDSSSHPFETTLVEHK